MPMLLYTVHEGKNGLKDVPGDSISLMFYVTYLSGSFQKLKIALDKDYGKSIAKSHSQLDVCPIN